MSPTILTSGPYRFYFVSHDLGEPPHVHVDRDECSAKFWLRPVVLAHNLGYAARELRRIEELVLENGDRFVEAWHAWFGTEGR